MTSHQHGLDTRHTQLESPHPTIFVVDDDEAICDSLQILLEVAGYRAATFGSAAAFLEALTKTGGTGAPSCVILDVHMPDADGRVLAADLAEQSPEVRVILMSGHDGHDLTEDARKVGAFAFLEKPVTHDGLLETLERALAR